MADAAHLAKLREGPVIWNAWRESNPGVVPDLVRADLALNQRQFGPSRGGPINLAGADLTGAMLRFATLTGADLGGACLTGADLMHARLDRARLARADLTDAMLDNADLTGASLDGAVLVGASLRNVRNLTQMQVEQAFGDASTLLPAALVPPREWFAAAAGNEDDSGWDTFADQEEEEEDAYALLGLMPGASPEEVRTAYRGLVKKLHPDLNPGDAAAALRFRKINDAYQMLRHLEEEAERDRLRSRRRQRWGLATSFAIFVLVAGGASYWFWMLEPDAVPGRMAPVRDDIAQSGAAGSGLGQGAAEQPPLGASTVSPAVIAEAEPAETKTVKPARQDAPEIVNTAAISKDEEAAAAAGQTSTATKTARLPLPAEGGAARDAATTPGKADNKSSGENAAGPQQASGSGGAERGEPAAAATARLDAQDGAGARPEKAAEEGPLQASGDGWEEAWRELRNSNDLLSLHGFVLQYPDAPPAGEARGRLRSLIATLEDADLLAEFLQGTEGQSGPEITEARERLTKIIVGDALRAEYGAWTTASKAGTKEAFEGYLRAYPKGPHARQAKDRIERIQRDTANRKRDEAAWAKARKDDTRAAYAAYLNAYPRGHFARDAQKKLAERAAAPKTGQGFDGFPQR
jgi:hypothetical protein